MDKLSVLGKSASLGTEEKPKPVLNVQPPDISVLLNLVEANDWSGLDSALRAHWSTTAPLIFPAHKDPCDLSFEENLLNRCVFAPLISLLCGKKSIPKSGEEAIMLKGMAEEAGLNLHRRQPGQICGKVFKSGELTYSCRDCANDPTCVMCYECFSYSHHRKHKYKMHSSGGSGYCDCGDPEAWNSEPYCQLHKPVSTDSSETEQEESSALPLEMENRAAGVMVTVLRFCVELLTWEKFEELPHGIEPKEKPNLPYQTMLFNDEYHTYDQVIKALKKAIDCVEETAMFLATVVDRDGRSSVRAGSKEECAKVKQIIVEKTTGRHHEIVGNPRRDPLEVHVMSSDLVAYQNLAVKLTSWMLFVVQEFPPLMKIVGKLFLETKLANDIEGDPMAVKVILKDMKLWKGARSSFHQLLMGTVLMEMEQKKQFSAQFTRLYQSLMQDFVKDSHDHSLSVASLTVQIYTVPTVARFLIATEDALNLLIRTLLTHCTKYHGDVNRSNPYNFNGRSFPIELKRALHVLYDVKYLLTTPPSGEEWTPVLRHGFMEGVRALLELIGNIQGMDKVHRHIDAHPEFDIEWETAFNMQLRIQTVLTLVQAWTATDAEVLFETMKAVLCKHRSQQEGYKTELITVANRPALSIIFDVSTQPLSVHIPITRLLAAQVINLGNFGRDFRCSEIGIDAKPTPTQLMELPLRILVMVAQVNAGMWRKNGFSLLNQIHNYGSPLCRMEMFDRDIQMLQIGASLIEPNEFVIHVLYRFGLVTWANEESGVSEDESGKQVASLVESFLQLIIMIYGERWVPGIGNGVTHKDALRREVLHVLCRGPMPFSKISNHLPDYPFFEKLPLEEIVREVGDFRQPTGTSAGVFELKSSPRKEFNPYFHHYSKTDCSEAEQQQERDRKDSTDKRVVACAPPTPPRFTNQMRGITNILSCDVMIEVLYLVLKRCAKKTRVSSDAQLRRALFLIGMALIEEKRDLRETKTDEKFHFTALVTDPERDRNLLTIMQGLVGTPEGKGATDLLAWTIAKFKEVQLMHKGGSAMDVESEGLEKGESAEEKRLKKQKLAETKRKKAMQQMARLQKQFIQKNKTLFEEAATDDDSVQDDPEHCALVNAEQFPVCLGPHQSAIKENSVPRKVTCILCQETEEVGFQGRAVVYAAYVLPSMLFSKGEKTAVENKEKLEPLFMPASLPFGVHTSTCGHTMHSECWQQFHASLVAKESRRQLHRRLFSYTIDVEGGEYQCPLCKRLSNAVLPILPHLKKLGLDREKHQSDLSFNDWLGALVGMVEAQNKKANQPGRLQRFGSAPGGSRKRSISLLSESSTEPATASARRGERPTSASTESSDTVGAGAGGSTVQGENFVGYTNASLSDDDDAAFVDAEEGLDVTQEENQPVAVGLGDMVEDETGELLMAALFPGQMMRNMQTSVVGQFQRLMRRMSSTHERVPISQSNYEMVKTFAQAVYTHGLGVNPDEKNHRVSILSAQTTAYTLKCIQAVVRVEEKPLFGAFASRQSDCFYSLVRYGACSQFACKNDVMKKHCLKLLSAFLMEAKGGTSSGQAVLNLDIFTTLIQICLSFGCLCVEEVDKWIVPSGGLNDLYLLRLMLSAYWLQLLVTWSPVIGGNVGGAPPTLSRDILRVVKEVKNEAGGKELDADWLRGMKEEDALRDLECHLRDGVSEFLRPCALFYHALTLVPPPEALKDPSIDEFGPLCRYLGVPDSLEGLAEWLFMEELWQRWCSQAKEMNIELTGQPVGLNRLQKLPPEFSELIHTAAQFSCPSMTSDDSRMPTMCLVCGQILCSQGYCCQKTLGDKQVGACTYHAHNCTAGTGIFLRIRDCQVILQHKRHRGCFRPAPYSDEWGETDGGFRRGNPLFLNEALMKRLEQLWLHHSVPEEVTNQLEMDTKFFAYDWVHF